MLRLLEGISRWIGILTAITTVIGFVYGLFRDPIYIAGALCMGSLALCGLAMEAWCRKAAIESKILQPSETTPRREYVYGKWSRRGISVAAAAMVIVTTIYAKSHFDGFFDLAEAYNKAWVGGGTKAVGRNGEGTYNFARILNQNDNPMSLGNDACAVTFDLFKRDLVQWVQVVDIRVVVHDYKPNPKKFSLTTGYGGLVEPHMFLIELDAHKGNYSILARYEHGDDGKPRKGKMGTIYLEKERSDPFFVRINAKKPGIYTISCEVEVSHKDRKRTIPIAGKAVFLFGEGK